MSTEQWSIEFYHTEWDTVPDLTEDEANHKFTRMVSCISTAWQEFDILAENLPSRLLLINGDGDVVKEFVC